MVDNFLKQRGLSSTFGIIGIFHSINYWERERAAYLTHLHHCYSWVGTANAFPWCTAGVVRLSPARRSVFPLIHQSSEYNGCILFDVINFDKKSVFIAIRWRDVYWVCLQIQQMSFYNISDLEVLSFHLLKKKLLVLFFTW